MAAAALALGAANLGFGQTAAKAAGGAPGMTGAVTPTLLRGAAASTGRDWLSYGLTAGETRYSPLKQIDTSNVARLGLDRFYELGAGGGGQEATPLVQDGVLSGRP